VYARLAAFEGGDSDAMRKMGEERMAEGKGPEFPEAVRRALVLASEDGSRRLFITFFDDKAALEASEKAFDKMGDEIPEDVRGRRVAVESYEVLLSWPE
jgi:hypothetical protein